MGIGVLIWIVSVILGVIIGNQKGEGCISLIMCVLLGPFWLPVVLLSTGNRKKCPYCQELVDKKAIVCPHCQKDIHFTLK